MHDFRYIGIMQNNPDTSASGQRLTNVVQFASLNKLAISPIRLRVSARNLPMWGF